MTHYTVEKRDLSRDEWTVVASIVKDTNYTINGLYESHEYEFRVSAVNDNGQGPPLNGDGPVVAKMAFDPPDAPGVPDVTQVAEDFVSLAWNRPKSDGGGRIIGYLIEKREVGMEVWQKCNTSPVPQTIFNVPNLIEGRQYEFRIFALNDAGISPPSSNSAPIIARPAVVAQPPEIISPLKNISAESGKSARLECEISGNPKPDIKWFKGARELIDSSKFQILNQGGRQVLIINEVFGEDADEYSCRASNAAGTRSTRAELFIKCELH